MNDEMKVGYVKINPFMWIDTIKFMQEKSVEYRDVRYKKLFDRYLDANRGYDWSKIPFLMKPIVYIFESSDIEDENIFLGYMVNAIENGTYSKRFSKYLESKESALVRMENEYNENPDRMFSMNPFVYKKGNYGYSYPEWWMTILNTQSYGVDELYITNEQYNELCKAARKMKEEKDE